jgi:uncharacterized protein YrrD
MMNSVSHLNGATVTAVDGAIGHIRQVFFDDQRWAIRYLVADTGKWLAGREVLISPYSVKQPLDTAKNVDVTLTRQQVQDSPNIDTHQPISRRHEREYVDYYTYPAYWGGDAMWAMSAMPLVPPALQAPVESQAERERLDKDVPSEDVHLRSSANVTGYDVQATDDSIGHVEDFLFDDETWAIRYLVIDTRNWWPGGKRVLVGTHWIDRIDWADRTVVVRLTRDQVKNGPRYEEDKPIDRDYERRLHDALDRRPYWD